MRKLFALLGIVVLALAVAVGAKTLLSSTRQLAVAPATPVKVDVAAAADRLGAAVRLKTIASRDDVDASAAEFLALHALLQASFPKAHAVLQREVIGKYGLVYTWPGTDPKAAGIGLMAHQDVVPIAPGTEGDWQQQPFSGVLKDGFVWGRGSWDDKGNLMSMMEAVELLAASGFKPRQTIYLIFGQDEEISGLRGALQIAKLFQQRGIHLQFVVDEGLLITEGLLAGLSKPAALVGVAEKGYLSVQLTASATPGHSSMPPPEAGQSAIGMMSVALARLEDQQMPLAVRGLSREMFETIAPEMNGMNRVFLSNLWLFKPVIEQQLQRGASTSALMRTTTALTIANAGNADNVLPGRASATVNFRLAGGQQRCDRRARQRSREEPGDQGREGGRLLRSLEGCGHRCARFPLDQQDAASTAPRRDRRPRSDARCDRLAPLRRHRQQRLQVLAGAREARRPETLSRHERTHLDRQLR
jgi:carboxypeptidase PM20D1